MAVKFGMKFKKVYTVPDSNGVKKLLNGEQINAVVRSVALEVEDDIMAKVQRDDDHLLEADERETWITEKSHRSDRVVYNVGTDDEDRRWKEMASGDIAKLISRKKVRRKSRRPKRRL